jgi:hypothetical protein
MTGGTALSIDIRTHTGGVIPRGMCPARVLRAGERTLSDYTPKILPATISQIVSTTLRSHAIKQLEDLARGTPPAKGFQRAKPNFNPPRDGQALRDPEAVMVLRNPTGRDDNSTSDVEKNEVFAWS